MFNNQITDYGFFVFEQLIEKASAKRAADVEHILSVLIVRIQISLKLNRYINKILAGKKTQLGRFGRIESKFESAAEKYLLQCGDKGLVGEQILVNDDNTIDQLIIHLSITQA